MLSTIFTLSLLGAAAAQAEASSNIAPDGWSPTFNKTLALDYGGTEVTPNKTMAADRVAEAPMVTTLDGETGSKTEGGKFMILMLDLNVPSTEASPSDGSATVLVPGQGVDTTTRLHWWAGNYTLDPDGSSFVSSSEPIAQYAPPVPTSDFFRHYIFYMFDQPDSYELPDEAIKGEYYDTSAGLRTNFDLGSIISAVGGPLSGNWFIANDGTAA